MRYYTKEWYRLLMQLGTAELFEPVIDKEYSDEEIRQLYEDCMEKYIEEERESYDEPPFLLSEIEEEDAEEQLRELDQAWDEYNTRPPFDEKEAAEEFAEQYKDSLDEPDEDIPAWVRESVDPRLIALELLPESVYRKLVAEEEALQEEFDKLDADVDKAMEENEDKIPAHYEEVMEEFDEREGDYIIGCAEADGDLEIAFLGWDDEGEEAYYNLVFEDAEIIEDEGLNIVTEVDEDGDTSSNCDLLYHEVYFNEKGDERIEVHMLIDNYECGLKYLTLGCSGFHVEQHR